MVRICFAVWSTNASILGFKGVMWVHAMWVRVWACMCRSRRRRDELTMVVAGENVCACKACIDCVVAIALSATKDILAIKSIFFA